MQNVKEQRFEQFRVLAHALEIETLEAMRTKWCLPQWSKRNPNSTSAVQRQPIGKRRAPKIREHAQRAQRRIQDIQVLDSEEQFPLGRWDRKKLPYPSFEQDSQNKCQEIEIFFGGRERKRIDI